VTAVETALKVKETSYLQAEGMPTETMLHGPFQCVEADDLFVLIAPSGVARERTLEVAELVEEVGASYVIVGDDTTEPRPGAAGVLRVPEVPEPFNALSCLVPLQLFSFFGMVVALGALVVYLVVMIQRVLRAGWSGPWLEAIWDRDILEFFLIGMVLFGLGLLGEYVGRIYQQVRDRPRYVIRAILERR